LRVCDEDGVLGEIEDGLWGQVVFILEFAPCVIAVMLIAELGCQAATTDSPGDVNPGMTSPLIVAAEPHFVPLRRETSAGIWRRLSSDGTFLLA
jgi:hypothetical protein